VDVHVLSVSLKDGKNAADGGERAENCHKFTSAMNRERGENEHSVKFGLDEIAVACNSIWQNDACCVVERAAAPAAAAFGTLC
jgi:hypothetical protein